MYVVYESPFAVVADSPDVYADAPGADFLAQVPATWDETRVLSGEIGEHVVIARRSGRDWYVGAMSNEQARSVSVPLDFLPAGAFEATLYQDGDEPADLHRETRRVDAKQALTLALAASGGAVVRLAPVTTGAD
jgi:alpha-glucosidase